MYLKYDVNSKPPFKYSVLYAFQHIVTMLGATVAVPLIMASQLNLDTDQSALLISNVLLCMGIATTIQSTIGSRLPIIQGSSFAFLPPMLFIATLNVTDPILSLRYISGAVILGAIFLVLIGFLGIAGRIQKILTPVVIGPVIIVIGLSLFKVGATQAGAYWPISILTIVLVFFFSYFIKKKTKDEHQFLSFLTSIPVLTSVTMVYIVCLIFSQTGFFSPEHPAFVNTNIQADWIRTAFPVCSWGFPIFNLPFFVAVLIAYGVITFESIGDYNAIADISNIDDSTKDGVENSNSFLHNKVSKTRVNRGIIAQGLGNLISGIIGGVPTTSYAENIGLVGITRVASRYVVSLAGIILIIIGLVPKAGALLGTIPVPVMGGLYCLLFGMISGIGIRITSKCDTSNIRNISIIGFTLFMAFSLPEFITTQVKTGTDLTDIIMGIGGSSMAVAAVIGITLDNIIPGKDKTPKQDG